MPLGGLAIAGVSSLASGIFGGKAAKKAATTQATAQGQAAQGVANATTSGLDQLAQQNANIEGSIPDTTSAYNAFTDAAPGAVSSLEDISSANGPLSQQFSFNPSDLQNDPGYKFTLDQGQQALQRSAAATGGLYGTNTLKSLAGYTTGTANQYFNDAFNRANTTFNTNRQGVLSRANTLQSLAQLGLSGTQAKTGIQQQDLGLINQNTTNAANLGVGGANSVGQFEVGAGNAKSAGTVGQTNSWLDALKQGSNGIQQFIATRNNGTSGTGTGTGPGSGSGFGYNADGSYSY